MAISSSSRKSSSGSAGSSMKEHNKHKCKKLRRKLNKRLSSEGGKIHSMDDKMFNNIKGMLESVDPENYKLAAQIILKAKMNDSQRNYFVQKYYKLAEQI